MKVSDHNRKKIKQLKATCFECDKLYKEGIPDINLSNIKKKIKDLEKIEDCVYILDNSWRRREQQQIEAIIHRGDIPFIDNSTYRIVTESNTMTKKEADHLDTAYIYRDRMRKCQIVRDTLRAKIENYNIKVMTKSGRKKIL